MFNQILTSTRKNKLYIISFNYKILFAMVFRELGFYGLQEKFSDKF